MSAQAASPDGVKVLDCGYCTSASSAKSLAIQDARFLGSGVYHTAVYNTVTGLIVQYEVNVDVESESGLVSAYAFPEVVNEALKASFDAWRVKYGAVDQKDIDITVDCLDKEKCGGSGNGAHFYDVQSYVRGLPAVNSELAGAINFVAAVKVRFGKVKMKVTVKWPDGSQWLLQITDPWGSVSSKLLEARDANGNVIKTDDTGGSSPSGAGTTSYGGNTISIGGGGGGGVWVVICVDDVCVTKLVV